MTDGIMYIALGIEYDALAAHTAAKTRENTDLPIAVVSNLALRHPKWDEIADVRFIMTNTPQNENRAVKTLMLNYTPFDRTMYIDCDAFVQRDGVERIFNVLGTNNLALYYYRAWCSNKQMPRIMARALDTFHLDVPIQGYHSGCFCFANNALMFKFFQAWHAAWDQFGRGRDMPPLACLLKQWVERGAIKVNRLEKPHFAAQWLDKNAIVQHDPGSGFPPEYGIPQWTPWRVPTDKPGEFQKITRKQA